VGRRVRQPPLGPGQRLYRRGSPARPAGALPCAGTAVLPDAGSGSSARALQVVNPRGTPVIITLSKPKKWKISTNTGIAIQVRPAGVRASPARRRAHGADAPARRATPQDYQTTESAYVVVAPAEQLDAKALLDKVFDINGRCARAPAPAPRPRAARRSRAARAGTARSARSMTWRCVSAAPPQALRGESTPERAHAGQVTKTKRETNGPTDYLLVSFRSRPPPPRLASASTGAHAPALGAGSRRCLPAGGRSRAPGALRRRSSTATRSCSSPPPPLTAGSTSRRCAAPPVPSPPATAMRSDAQRCAALRCCAAAPLRR